MRRYQGEIEARNAQVVAVACDAMERAQEAVGRMKLTFPCLVDEDHLVYDQYDVQSKLLSLGQRPALFIIDREGIVQYAQVGTQQWEIPDTAEILDRLDQLNEAPGHFQDPELDSAPGSTTADP